MAKKDKKGITVKKNDDFSEWFTQLYSKADLADIRTNVKGVVAYMPWAVYSFNKMWAVLENSLEKRGHWPVLLPGLIPESNLTTEAEHVEGFTPEVYWVTEHGKGEKFDERLALRPTSEAMFYHVWKNWIRGKSDLPKKQYIRGQVWRYEGKATRPFFRSREFYWIEAHDAFATMEESEEQVRDDMETTKELLWDCLAIPFIFFRRPQWDKFPGAVHTFAADALMPSGKVLQLPSTHLLGQNFSKSFGVSFEDKTGKKNFPYTTCYGPAVSRIYGGLISLHGDDKGLVLPWDIAPLEIVIVPILSKGNEKVILDKCNYFEKELKSYRVKIDESELSAGEKFNKWEMKGVPVRIEVGIKDIDEKQVVIFRRDLNEKKVVKEKDLINFVKDIKKSFTSNLQKKTEKNFKDNIVDVESLNDLKKAIDSEKIVRCNFCSDDLDGEKCAEVIEKEVSAFVRGTKLDKEEVFGSKKCIVCGKKAKEVVYVAKSY